MVWLVLGVLVWSVMHLFPSVAAGARSRLIAAIGEQAYKGGFALSLVVAIVLMVVGWRSTPPRAVYAAPVWGADVAMPLVFVALALFVASGAASNVKRVLRHPQLTGVAVWAAAHLFSNGDGRSLVLFGGLGVWAVVTIAAINRRDGAWTRPGPQPLVGEVKLLAIAGVAFAVLFFVHPYIAGVSLTLG